jgi:hypothetical protein
MNQPSNQPDDVQGAGVYPTDSPTAGQAPAGTPGTSGVRVYDRPDSPQGGLNMSTIILMIIALMIIGAVIWSVMT